SLAPAWSITSMHASFEESFGRPGRLIWTVSLCLVALPPGGAVAAEGRTGGEIYRQRCAACHGSKGEGTEDNYARPLKGEKSVAQLARFISKSMPKDSPQ